VATLRDNPLRYRLNPLGTGARLLSTRRSPMTAATIGTVFALTLVAGPGHASAAPPDPSGSTSQSSSAVPAPPEEETALEEAARLQSLVDAAQAEVDQATVEAEATVELTRLATLELDAANAAPTAAAAAVQAAQARTGQAQTEVAAAGRAAFMGSGDLAQAGLLLQADDPDDLLSRATTLAVLADHRAEDLDALEQVQDQQEAADLTARQAVQRQQDALAAAQAADAQAAAQLDSAQQSYTRAAGELDTLQQQLQAAQIDALTEQGIDDPAAVVAAQQAAVAGSGGDLVAGRVTSCYGPRGGTNHNGIDIAAPIGTPIYAPDGGVVLDAGPANGFGLAVYIQHPDGTITVYGHINQFFVTAGEAVQAGDLIAEVGNRGQSTGPHLHIETHVGGLYATRTDPSPWLAQRGITLGGRCG
ncbi:peptidase M23, partial [Klenkia terrae]